MAEVLDSTSRSLFFGCCSNWYATYKFNLAVIPTAPYPHDCTYIRGRRACSSINRLFLCIACTCTLLTEYSCCVWNFPLNAIGGGLVSVTDDSPHLNVTNIDINRLHSELLSSIKSTLSEDVHRHVEEHVDKVYINYLLYVTGMSTPSLAC